jgi:hypothetical protein
MNQILHESKSGNLHLPFSIMHFQVLINIQFECFIDWKAPRRILGVLLMHDLQPLHLYAKNCESQLMDSHARNNTQKQDKRVISSQCIPNIETSCSTMTVKLPFTLSRTLTNLSFECGTRKEVYSRLIHMMETRKTASQKATHDLERELHWFLKGSGKHIEPLQNMKV